MQEKSSNNMDEKLINRIIAVAYGDAGWFDKSIINRKAKQDNSIKQMFEEYRLTANSVHQMKQAELPEFVLQQVRQRMEHKSENSFLSLIYLRFLSRPLLSSAVVGMIIIAIVSIILLNHPQPQQKYTKAQIELAEKQLKESLAIVGKVFSRAEEKFDKDVLNNQINKSLGKGFNLVNDILIGG